MQAIASPFPPSPAGLFRSGRRRGDCLEGTPKFLQVRSENVSVLFIRVFFFFFLQFFPFILVARTSFGAPTGVFRGYPQRVWEYP